MTEYISSSAIVGFGLGLTFGWVLKGRIKNPFVYVNTATQVLLGHGTKLVLVVRTDLGMKKGKVASQCAHAAVSCFRKAATVQPDIVRQWELAGQPKIILKLEGENLLRELKVKAEEQDLVTSLISDAGRTQVKTGSVTVLGIGPGKSEIIDSIVGNFKLY